MVPASFFQGAQIPPDWTLANYDAHNRPVTIQLGMAAADTWPELKTNRKPAGPHNRNRKNVVAPYDMQANTAMRPTDCTNTDP